MAFESKWDVYVFIIYITFVIGLILWKFMKNCLRKLRKNNDEENPEINLTQPLGKYSGVNSLFTKFTSAHQSNNNNSKYHVNVVGIWRNFFEQEPLYSESILNNTIDEKSETATLCSTKNKNTDILSESSWMNIKKKLIPSEERIESEPTVNYESQRITVYNKSSPSFKITSTTNSNELENPKLKTKLTKILHSTDSTENITMPKQTDSFRNSQFVRTKSYPDFNAFTPIKYTTSKNLKKSSSVDLLLHYSSSMRNGNLLKDIVQVPSLRILARNAFFNSNSICSLTIDATNQLQDETSVVELRKSFMDNSEKTKSKWMFINFSQNFNYSKEEKQSSALLVNNVFGSLSSLNSFRQSDVHIQDMLQKSSYKVTVGGVMPLKCLAKNALKHLVALMEEFGPFAFTIKLSNLSYEFIQFYFNQKKISII